MAAIFEGHRKYVCIIGNSRWQKKVIRESEEEALEWFSLIKVPKDSPPTMAFVSNESVNFHKDMMRRFRR